jgi:hypothetical protein
MHINYEFFFSALTAAAAGRGARDLLEEVGRQVQAIEPHRRAALRSNPTGLLRPVLPS